MEDVHHCPRCELRFISKWELQDHLAVDHAPPMPGHEVAQAAEATMTRHRLGLLDAPQVTEALARLPGWTRAGDAIEKTYDFPSFMEAIHFVERVARYAEAADHHPDIDVRYRRVRLVLSTHVAGGITVKDIDLATRIETTVAV